MISQSQFSTSILPLTLQYEGGYANVSGDKGGETYRGITRKNWPNWSGWAVVDKKKPIAHNALIPELESAVNAFYYANYFKNKGFHNINATKVAAALFDFAVHGGYSVKALQTLLNQRHGARLTVDGAMGTATIKAVNAANPDTLTAHIIDMRKQHLTNIVTNDPTQAKFWNGWMNRLSKLAAALQAIRNNPIAAGLGFVLAAALVWAYMTRKGAKNEKLG